MKVKPLILLDAHVTPYTGAMLSLSPAFYVNTRAGTKLKKTFENQVL